MNIHPIRNQADHQRALTRVSTLMQLDPEPGTPESDELEVLAQLVELYEKKQFDIGQPEALDLILFAMEQQGLKNKDMVAYLGSPSRVSEVLGGKRPLTMLMIRNLHRGLGLPLLPLVMGAARPKSPPHPKASQPKSSFASRLSSSKRRAKLVMKKRQYVVKTKTV